MRKENSKHSLSLDNHTLLDNGYPFLDGHVIVGWLDHAGIFISMNQSLLDMSGYLESELIGSPFTVLKHPEIPNNAYDELCRKVNAGKRWKGLIKLLRKDGAYFWGLTTIMPITYKSLQNQYLCTVRKPSLTQITSYKEKYLLTTKAG